MAGKPHFTLSGSELADQTFLLVGNVKQWVCEVGQNTGSLYTCMFDGKD